MNIRLNVASLFTIVIAAALISAGYALCGKDRVCFMTLTTIVFLFVGTRLHR